MTPRAVLEMLSSFIETADVENITSVTHARFSICSKRNHASAPFIHTVINSVCNFYDWISWFPPCFPHRGNHKALPLCQKPVNTRRFRLCVSALPELDELTMEQVLVELESRCQQNMQQAIETQEGLGIEYDEDVVCDVCRSPEGEDGNEMVFCDKCNVCVHQVFNPKTILIVLRSECCNDNTSGRIHIRKNTIPHNCYFLLLKSEARNNNQ